MNTEIKGSVQKPTSVQHPLVNHTIEGLCEDNEPKVPHRTIEKFHVDSIALIRPHAISLCYLTDFSNRAPSSKK